VLIACEYSGTVRDAFAALGHDAVSCDLIPSLTPGAHIIGDAIEVAYGEKWDLMVAHPPCTYLSYAGIRHWNATGRSELRADAMRFFLELYAAPIARVCVENPVGHLNSVWRKPDQIINPFQFGDSIRKRTCLWLRGLRPLEHRATDELFGPQTHVPPPPVFVGKKNGKAYHFTEAISGSRQAGHRRAHFFRGVAAAMAQQWGVA
jgi:hypothetical protein